MKPIYEQIPEAVRALPNWVVWRWEKRRNRHGAVKKTKVPYNARTGKHGKSNDPRTWSSLDEAVTAYEREYDGIGLCLSERLIAADLDGCYLDGVIEPWAQQIVDELDSYTEITPSRTGLRVLVEGELPDGRRQLEFGDRPHHGVGLYEAGGPRYVAMTGWLLNGSRPIAERTAELARIHARLFPPEPKRKDAGSNAKAGAPLADDELIRRARKANDGGKFSRLWDGQWESDYPSQSEADLALSMKLAFWTGRDAGRMDSLFRQSRLMRDKWERQDYRERTIAIAIQQATETWKPKSGGQQSSRPARRAYPVAPATALIHLDQVEPTWDLLNSLTVWQGRITWTEARRKGPMLIATTTANAEVVWTSMAELGSFPKSQAAILDAANILIPTPKKGQIRWQWEQAIHLLLKLADKNVWLEPALKQEIRDLVRLVWEAAGQPTAQDNPQFIYFMRKVQSARRNPRWGMPEPPARPGPGNPETEPPPGDDLPPCVFIAEGKSWVHVPSFRVWLSIPALINRMPPLADVRNGLLLLGFIYHENLTRRDDDDKESLCLWEGPLEALQ
jgi:hypothetical protein